VPQHSVLAQALPLHSLRVQAQPLRAQALPLRVQAQPLLRAQALLLQSPLVQAPPLNSLLAQAGLLHSLAVQALVLHSLALLARIPVSLGQNLESLVLVSQHHLQAHLQLKELPQLA